MPVQLEREASDRLVIAIVANAQIAHRERDRSARSALAPGEVQLIAADHKQRELVLIGDVGGDGADVSAVAQDADPVANLHHLFQLVADEHDGRAAGGQPPERHHQFTRLLRRQDRGGLVQNEHLGATAQGADDLHALLLTDRQVGHQCLRIQRQADALGIGHGLPLKVAHRHALQERGLADRVVLGHRQGRHQHEMLVHHADTVGERLLRAIDGHGAAVDEDAPAVGPVEPVQDVHERRLAGAILSQQGVDLAGADVDRHAVVGDDVAEPLRDVDELNVRHGGSSHSFPRRA